MDKKLFRKALSLILAGTLIFSGTVMSVFADNEEIPEGEEVLEGVLEEGAEKSSDEALPEENAALEENSEKTEEEAEEASGEKAEDVVSEEKGEALTEEGEEETEALAEEETEEESEEAEGFMGLFSMFGMARSADTWDPASGVYQISTLDDLIAFRDAVNSGNTFSGITITLEDNIDMSSINNWTPIGNGSRNGKNFSGNNFQGIFDGQGYTISNLTIGTDVRGDVAVGLFGVVNGDNYSGNLASGTSGVVKNLVLSNVNINTPSNELCGAAIGFMVNDATADNISVTSGSIKGLKGVGGIAGRIAVCGTVTNCSNAANVSTGSATNQGNVGGIVGAAYYTDNCNEMCIENCTNTGNISGGACVGGIVGLSAADVKGCRNSGTITGTYTGTGGIVGEQDPCGEVSGNTNTGNINNSDKTSGTGGGIVGWVRYANNAPASYARTAIIKVSGNTNTGTIDGGTYGGGIVGLVYNAGIISDNDNSAASITGSKFAAGIVGAYQDNEKPGNLSFAYPALNFAADNSSTTDITNISALNTNSLIYMNPNVQFNAAAEPNQHQHQIQAHPVSTPTCTDPGYSLYYTCDWCHAVFDADKTTQLARGYMIYNDDAYKATAIAEEKAAVAAKEIKAPGHLYDQNSFDIFGTKTTTEWFCDTVNPATGHHKECCRDYTSPATFEAHPFAANYVCGYVSSPSEPHQFTSWTETTQPAGSVAGTEARVCKDCGYTETHNFYVVSFDSKGGTPVADQKVYVGDKVDETLTVTTRSGYVFIEWQLKGDKYDFTKPVGENMILEAVWRSTGGGNRPVPPTPTPGPDPTPEPDPDIEEPETPLGPAPEIEEEDVPMAVLPQTGLDWNGMMALIFTGLGLSLAGVLFFTRKRTH